MKLSDVVKIIPKFDKYGDPLPFFTKTEKQQIEGAPEGITQEKQLFDLIVGTEEEFHIAGGINHTIKALKNVRSLTEAVLVCKRGPYLSLIHI